MTAAPAKGVHLAQVNVGRLRHPIDHPATTDFVDGLAPVNALADASPGFVWRLHRGPDAEVHDHLRVRTSVEALHDFVYRSAHTPFLRRRAEWFDRMTAPSVALWWVPAGHQPDVAEARLRLEFLEAHGASPYAFGLRSPEPPLVIERSSLDDPVASQLIAELDADLIATTAPGSNFFSLDASEVADGRGAFVVARLDGEPVGCGALRVLEAGEWPERTAELKRMYVRPTGRGRRIGSALLTELTALARSLGVRRLVLETADQQVAALSMYRSQGFEPCPCWGEYAGAPLSRCFSRPLG